MHLSQIANWLKVMEPIIQTMHFSYFPGPYLTKEKTINLNMQHR